jgi:hypothetical protein
MPLSNQSRRNSCHDRSFRNIMRYNSGSRHNCSGSNGYPRQYNSARSNPTMVTNGNWSTTAAVVRVLHVMLQSPYPRRLANGTGGTNAKFASPAVEDDIAIDANVVAHRNGPWAQQPYAQQHNHVLAVTSAQYPVAGLPQQTTGQMGANLVKEILKQPVDQRLQFPDGCLP